jgi:hypothetical protein
MPRRIPILAALALLLATTAVTLFGVAARNAGQQALAEVLARHDAAGYGTTAVDLAAMAPPVDRSRQARLYTWMKAEDARTATYRVVHRDPAWWRRDGVVPPDEAREAHRAFEPEIEALEALFAGGDLCLTSLGWLPEDPEAATIPELLAGPIPNLLRMRSAWDWYSVETALAKDPSRALAMLQRLHESTARAGCLIDSMCAVACDAMRDDTMVLLATASRCSEAQLESWLAEPPRAAGLVADGIRGERLRFSAPLAHELVAGSTVADILHDMAEHEDQGDLWEHHVRPWVEGASDCAAHLEGMVALERTVRGEIPREELDLRLAACEDVGYPFSLVMPNTSGMLDVASSSADRHVLVRAAVALARAAEERAEVPSTETEALVWLREERPGLLPDGDRTAFRYHRLANDRFRVTTNLDDAGDELDPQGHDAGRPLVLRHDLVEVQVR